MLAIMLLLPLYFGPFHNLLHHDRLNNFTCKRPWPWFRILTDFAGPHTRTIEAYCKSSSSSICNSLSCFFAYIVIKIVVATVAQKPTTVKIICGAERPWCSCEASARVRIKIPLKWNKWNETKADKHSIILGKNIVGIHYTEGGYNNGYMREAPCSVRKQSNQTPEPDTDDQTHFIPVLRKSDSLQSY